MTSHPPEPTSPRRQRRLETRLRTISLLLLAPLVVVGAVSAVALDLSLSSSAAVTTAQQEQREIDSARANVAHVVSLGETFIASGDPEDSFAMAGAGAQVQTDLRRLAALEPLQPSQPQLVAAVTRAWQASQAVRDRVISWAPLQEPAAVEKVANQFTQSLQDVSDRLDALSTQDAAAVASLRSDLSGTVLASAVAVGVALVVGVVAALFLTRRFALSLLGPLRRLRAATERLADGGSAGHLPTDGDDELADVASAFNLLADRLQERQEAVELRERRLAALVENASDGIMVVSPGGIIEFVTPSLRDEFDITSAASGALSTRIHPDDYEPVVRAWQRILVEPGATAQVETRLMHTDGTWRHVWAKLANYIEDPAVAGVVLNVTDVSERHQYEQQLSWQALHDPLTRLANRELLRRRLDQAQQDRDGATDSMLYLDVDDFKRINDTVGHANGDAYLVEVAARLTASVRPQDLVARIGGDEFAVLLDGASAEDAVRAAERVLTTLHQPLRLADRELTPNASLGVATVGVESTTAESLLGDADLAMYFAKRRAKGSACAFEATMRRELVDQVQLGEDLRDAVEAGALTVVYQPMVRLADGSTAGVEALARWNHPTRGPIPPTVFIPLAEQLRLVSRIDTWVMRQACRQLRAWDEAGLAPIRVAVNISGSELADAGLPSAVQAILDEAGLSPDRLELELTESVAVAESEAELAVVRELKQLGVHLSIDDFGTGYSALGRLRSLPFDTLKVDKAFIDALGDPSGGATLVETILEMARVLGLDVVAEGVETAQQATALREQECSLAQGYYFSRPVASEAIEAILRRASARTRVGQAATAP